MPKNFLKKQLLFSKVSRYNINTQKSVVLLHTSNEQSEKEIKKAVPFTKTSKRIEYLGINPTKEVKNSYAENYKTLLKEVKDLNKWKDILCPWIGRLNIVKISILYTAIYRFNKILIKILTASFTEIQKVIFIFIWNCKGPWIAKTMLKKKNKVGGLTFPNLKIYFKFTVIKTMWYLNKCGHTDQWNGIENPEINSKWPLVVIWFFKKHLYWSIIALQWCVCFCFITKWISSIYTYIPISPPSCISLPHSLSHLSTWPQTTELISLCYAAAPAGYLFYIW